MWVEFVVGSILAPRVFPWSSKFQFNLKSVDEEPLRGCATVSSHLLVIFILLNLHVYYILDISAGKEQVTVGIVPLDSHHQSSQSAKSVYPVVIANCKENRLVMQ